MAALPYFPFFTGDWLRDTRFLSAQAKGCWIDTLAVLWDSKTRGLLSHPVCGWARLWGVTEDEALNTIDALKGVAEVETHGSRIYILSRRMIREELEREEAKNRKRRERNQVEDFRYKVRLTELSSQIPTLSQLHPELAVNPSQPCHNLVTTLSQRSHKEVTGNSPPIPESIVQSKEREKKTPKRAIPTIEQCEQAARNHCPEDMHDFAASVAREFHGVFSSMQPAWITRGGDDLTKNQAWIHKLRTKLEQEIRHEISRRNFRRKSNNVQAGQPDKSSSRGERAGDGINVKKL